MIWIIIILIIITIIFIIYYFMKWECIDGKCEITFKDGKSVYNSLKKCRSLCNSESFKI